MTLSSVIFFTSFTNLIWPFGIKWALIDRVWDEEKGKIVFIILTVMYLYIMGIFSSSSSSIEKCDEVTGMNYAIGLIMVSLFLIIFLEKTDFVVWLAGIFGQYNNNNTQLLILGFLLMVFSWPIVSLIWFESQKIGCSPKKKDLDKFGELIDEED